MQDDPLLYSFNEDEEDDYMALDDHDELVRDLRNIEEICIEDMNELKKSAHGYGSLGDKGRKGVPSTSNDHANMRNSSNMEMINVDLEERDGSTYEKAPDQHSKGSIVNLFAKDIKKVNENYFGAYSSFSIHREMLSDKVRMDAYSQAILKNPSLLTGAVVMDVSCGTGILSLFAAKAGASRVIAVEASEKMAAVATQIAKENGLW